MDPLPISNAELKSIKHLLNLLRKSSKPQTYRKILEKAQNDIYDDGDEPDNIHGVEDIDDDEAIAAHIVLGSEDPTSSSSSGIGQLMRAHSALPNSLDLTNAYHVKHSGYQQKRDNDTGARKAGTNRQQRTFFEKVGNGGLERVTTLRQTSSYSVEIKKAPKRKRRTTNVCAGGHGPTINVKAIAKVGVRGGRGGKYRRVEELDEDYEEDESE